MTEQFGEPLDPIASLWRERLLEAMTPSCRGLPLLLSGGTDSATLLAAMLVMGEQPPCYSFKLGDVESADFKVSRLMCDEFGLEFCPVTIDRTDATLKSDVTEVIQLLGKSKKAQVQCAQPVMHICRAMASDGHSGCVVGTGAVCLDDRTVHVLWRTEGEEAARDYRRDKLEDRYKDCGTGAMHTMARLCGTPMEEPYSDEPLLSHAIAMDYAELNRLGTKFKQKGIALRAFPEFWSRGWYRRNSSLQVNSGVREWHDTLLADAELNPDGRHRAVVGIYNQIRRRVVD